MSEENRTPSRPFVEISDVYHSGESASEGEDNLHSQLLNRRLSSSGVDRKINAIIYPLATQLEMLIQSVSLFNEKIRTDGLKGLQHQNYRDGRVNFPTIIFSWNLSALKIWKKTKRWNLSSSSLWKHVDIQEI